MQGFVDLDDEALGQVGPWLRLAPAICAVWTAVGTVLASPAVLWSLVPFAVLGAATRGHPFDAIYNHGIRRLLRTPALPPYRAPRRFACAVATVWLTITGLAFAVGWWTVGSVLGAGLVVAALVPTTTDFCIPSFVYGLLFGRPMSCTSPRR
jgi:hypothetical protein